MSRSDAKTRSDANISSHRLNLIFTNLSLLRARSADFGKIWKRRQMLQHLQWLHEKSFSANLTQRFWCYSCCSCHRMCPRPSLWLQCEHHNSPRFHRCLTLTLQKTMQYYRQWLRVRMKFNKHCYLKPPL